MYRVSIVYLSCIYRVCLGINSRQEAEKKGERKRESITSLAELASTEQTSPDTPRPPFEGGEWGAAIDNRLKQKKRSRPNPPR